MPNGWSSFIRCDQSERERQEQALMEARREEEERRERKRQEREQREQERRQREEEQRQKWCSCSHHLPNQRSSSDLPLTHPHHNLVLLPLFSAPKGPTEGRWLWLWRMCQQQHCKPTFAKPTPFSFTSQHPFTCEHLKHTHIIAKKSNKSQKCKLKLCDDFIPTQILKFFQQGWLKFLNSTPTFTQVRHQRLSHSK